jgi:penicillin-binding protein 1A
MGFTPQVTTGSWVGFDTLRSLGPRGTGGGTALPIWLDYMQEAVKNYPDVGFTVPQGVAFNYINGNTGRLVSATTPGAVKEAFIEGTEPARTGGVTRGGAAHPAGGGEDSHQEDFLKEDFQ